MSGGGETSGVRFEATDRPPQRLAAALGAQSVALIVAGIVLTPVIVLRAAGAEATYGAWAVFMALVVSGAITIVQAVRIGRIGAGYILFMGTSGAFISVAVAAIQNGGMALLMTLIVASSLLQFPLAAKLGLLRRIITPAVGGTAIMLIAVTVMPIAFGLLQQVPAAAADPSGAPVTALATLLVIVAIAIFASRPWRLWSPLIGLVAGCLVAWPFGLLDLRALAAADWIGLPAFAWPGLDLGFGQAFWELLPAFLIVTLVGAIETFGDGIAIQRVSWRRPRAVDFRAVQGAVYADGLGNLLSGLAGTLPNTTYSTSVAVVDMTGVAARRVAVWGGGIMLALAFSPKLAQLLLAVPNPVVGAYVVVLLLLLFMHGLTLATEEGLSFETSLVVGLGFWLGVGFQQKALYFDQLPPWAAALLSNGMTAGTLVAILLTLMLRLKRSRRRRLQVPLATGSLVELQAFVQAAAREAGWDRAAQRRLELAAEETLVVLLDRQPPGARPCKLRLEAREVEGGIELDIVAGPQEANLEDELVRHSSDDAEPEAALSFRILASIAEELRHRQYHGVDFLTLKVASRPL